MDSLVSFDGEGYRGPVQRQALRTHCADSHGNHKRWTGDHTSTIDHTVSSELGRVGHLNRDFCKYLS